MNTFVFRPATAGDIPALAALCADAPDPWRAADFTAELTKPGTLLLVAWAGDLPAGFACFWQEEDAAELALVAVGSAYRRKGLGQALLAAAFDALAARGVRRVVLEVRASNKAALALYEKLGFGLLARRPGLYAAPAEDGLCLQKEWTGEHPC